MSASIHGRVCIQSSEDSLGGHLSGSWQLFDLMTNETQASSYFPCSCCDYKLMPSCLAFRCGFWELNSSPCAQRANDSQTDP